MLLCQFADQLTDLDDLLWIKSYAWLIQYNDLRESQNRLRKPHSLSVSFGEIFYQTVLHIFDLHQFFHFRDLICAFRFLDTL